MKEFWKIHYRHIVNIQNCIIINNLFFVFIVSYFFASINHGGQFSVSLQLVNTPLFTVIMFLSLRDDTPSNLGSLSETANTSLWISIFVFLATNFLYLD